MNAIHSASTLHASMAHLTVQVAERPTKEKAAPAPAPKERGKKPAKGAGA